MAPMDILTPGMNLAFPDGSLRLSLDQLVKVDKFVLALDESGKVTGDGDLCFYNQTSILDNAVRVEEISIFVEPSRLPERVARLVICAAPGTEGVAFGDLGPLNLDLSGPDGRKVHLDLKNRGMRETALIMAEIYRRNGGWRIRCVSQGYIAGLEVLLTSYGVELASGSDGSPVSDAPTRDMSAAGEQDLLPAPDRKMCALADLASERIASLAHVSAGSSRVVLALDLSGSMDENYRSGRLEPALRAVTALAHTLSPGGTAELMFFGRNLHEHGPIDTESCLDVSALALRRYLLEARTLYGGMMGRIREVAKDGKGPVLAIVIADGGPDDLDRAEWELSASRDEPVFWSFIGLTCGMEVLDRRRMSFMDKIMQSPLPNAGVQILRSDIAYGPEELIEGITEQLRRAAPAAQLPHPN